MALVQDMSKAAIKADAFNIGQSSFIVVFMFMQARTVIGQSA
jgi:hypothetical protein